MGAGKNSVSWNCLSILCYDYSLCLEYSSQTAMCHFTPIRSLLRSALLSEASTLLPFPGSIYTQAPRTVPSTQACPQIVGEGIEVFSDPCLVPREGKTHWLAFKSLSIVDPTHFASLRLSLSTYARVLATCPFLRFLSAQQALLHPLLPPYLSLSFEAHPHGPSSWKALLTSPVGWDLSLLQTPQY